METARTGETTRRHTQQKPHPVTLRQRSQSGCPSPTPVSQLTFTGIQARVEVSPRGAVSRALWVLHGLHGHQGSVFPGKGTLRRQGLAAASEEQCSDTFLLRPASTGGARRPSRLGRARCPRVSRGRTLRLPRGLSPPGAEPAWLLPPRPVLTARHSAFCRSGCFHTFCPIGDGFCSAGF